MIKHRIILLFLALGLLINCTNTQSTKQQTQTTQNKKMDSYKVNKTEDEWKKQLSPEQYNVLREQGTERAFSGKYWNTKDKGFYCCAGCDIELFTSDQKFDSECGWPSFDQELGKGEKIIKKVDNTFGMTRTEIICANCGGHLGHLFDDGPTNTGVRYCVNSASLNLIKK